jgi:SAM-dependent methyltransferase
MNTGVALHCGAMDCLLNRGSLVTDAGMEFIRCPTCGVLRLPPKSLVEASVRPDPPGRLSIVMKFLMSMRMRWLTRELPELGDRRVKIADVGCGDGQFLEFLKADGYGNIVGIEPDLLRARNAEKRGIPVFTTGDEAAAAGSPAAKVDVLFVWHVFEHIEAPADFIEKYRRWLAPSGIMVISVPNQASMQTRLFGYFSAFPDYGRHVWYHTAGYLRWFAQNAPTLEATIMRDRNYEYEVFSWVDSFASTITRRQNFIHRALKKREGGPMVRLAAALMAMCLLPPALLLSPLSIHLGLGSTLTYVLRLAVKPAHAGLVPPHARAEAQC